MPQAPATEIPEVLAETWRKLPPARQSSLLDYACYLASLEDGASLHEVDEEDEAEWDRLFSDEVKMANFRRWAEKALAEPGGEPLDLNRL